MKSEPAASNDLRRLEGVSNIVFSFDQFSSWNQAYEFTDAL
jgi:hypothetical protein